TGRPEASRDEGAPPPWEDPIPFGEWNRPPFPSQLFPPWMGNYIRALAEATQTPPDLAGMLVLGIAGAGLAKRYRVQPRPGWTEPTNLYCITALDVGNRKSAVFEATFRPVKEFEKEEVESLRPTVAALESERRILEEQLKIAEKKAAKEADLNERQLL